MRVAKLMCEGMSACGDKERISDLFWQFFQFLIMGRKTFAEVNCYCLNSVKNVMKKIYKKTLPEDIHALSTLG